MSSYNQVARDRVGEAAPFVYSHGVGVGTGMGNSDGGLGIGGPNTARHTGSRIKTSACCLSQLEFAPTIAVTGLSIAGVSRGRVSVGASVGGRELQHWSE